MCVYICERGRGERERERQRQRERERDRETDGKRERNERNNVYSNTDVKFNGVIVCKYKLHVC